MSAILKTVKLTQEDEQFTDLLLECTHSPYYTGHSNQKSKQISLVLMETQNAPRLELNVVQGNQILAVGEISVRFN